MCGVVGVVSKNKKIDEPNLLEMRDSMIHRGPDASGFFVDEHVGLGHRRLSILDLSDYGKQPMTYENLIVVFNGEIYNFLEIKKELSDLGHSFLSKTDTEVILHAYKEWGNDCVKKFNGMFAFAIYDMQNGKIIIVRDRLGIKPLYYYVDSKNETLIFSSEIKAITKYSSYESHINKEMLFDFFRYSFVPGEDTLFAGVKELLPGQMMFSSIFDPCKISFESYWDLPIGSSVDSLEQASEKIDTLLREIVKSQLISDVKVGVQLSGGLDSSLVANYAQEASPHINSISVDVTEGGLSERKYAEYVAEKFNLNSHFLNLQSDNFSEHLERVLYIFDEPLPHANSLGIYLLSKYAKENVTVLLSGEGADELFCGYTRYKELKAYNWISKIPFAAVRNKIANKVLGNCYYNYLTEIQKKPFDDFYIKNVYNCVSKKDLQKIFTENVKISDNNSYLRLVLEKVKGRGIVNAASGYDLKNYLVSLLHRQDRMSMAFSIENRVPFLDHRLVEYVYALPQSYKLKGDITKYILKKIGLKYFDDAFVYRAKQGFPISIENWLKGPAGLELVSILLDDECKKRGLFKHEEMERIVGDFKAGKKVNVGLLWALIVFEKWARIYFKN